MKLYNSLISNTSKLLSSATPKRFPYRPDQTWQESDEFELIMLRSAAFELGGDNKPSVSFTCVTTNPELVDKDEILLYGPDLSELKANSTYARIALIHVGDIESDDADDTEQAYRAIQNIDFVKYHVFPRGFMMRTSAESHREQVRISKEAITGGISFEAIGNTFLNHYHRDPNVLAVRLIFITDPKIDYGSLREYAKSAKSITLTLSKILEGMPTDCGSCNLKPICDEVEGMKELHFGKEFHTAE